MFDCILSFLAPHHCYKCGKTGKLLCKSCTYDIISEPMTTCLACGRAIVSNGLCDRCCVPYRRAWSVAPYDGAIGEIIKSCKFTNNWAATGLLGDLINNVLPSLPPNVIIVPIPTVSSHVRVRGYDQTYMVACRLARRRHLQLARPLVRLTGATQHGASRRQRIQQARVAFGVRTTLDPEKIYLLVDDVVTTGATMYYAAQTLKAAGAKEVWSAALARHNLKDLSAA